MSSTDPTAESEYQLVGKPVIDEATLDRLMGQVDAEGLELLGPDGVLTELTSRIMNRALEVEMTEHLGYEHGDPAGRGSGNNRNGTSSKTVLTDAGAVPVKVPRDRNSEFEPQLVPKHVRRLDGFNDIVLSLLSRGMTTRDITAHLAEPYQVEVSAELISKIGDAVIPELRAWQSRPLDDMYPIMYLDAIVVKVRTDGRVTNRPVYVAMAVDLRGCKHVLGLWLGAGDEGSKFWLGILTELRNRGVTDVLIVCCDGLTGFSDAIGAVWPQTVVQTCVVHLIRNSIRFCTWKDRKPVVKALKPIYTAPSAEAAGRGARGLRQRLGWDLRGNRGSMAPELGPVHPVPRFRASHPQNRIHHQRHRIVELPTPQSHQNQRLVPHRRRRTQNLLPSHQQHRTPPQRRTRNQHPRLETSTQRVRRLLPRPSTRHPQLDTTHKILDKPRHSCRRLPR